MGQWNGLAWEPDAILEIRAVDGTRGRLAVVVRRRLHPRDVITQRPLWRTLVDKMPVLVLTSRTRQVLDDAQFGYADRPAGCS